MLLKRKKVIKTDELVVFKKSVPQTLPELAKFAMFGRELLAARKAEIQAIRKLETAQGVYEQKKQEAQELAELVTLSEMQIGKMLKEIPTQEGRRTDLETSLPYVNEVKTKTQIAEDLGYNKRQMFEFQHMADNEDAVKEAIIEAKENDDIVSRRAVMKKIKEKQEEVKTNEPLKKSFNPIQVRKEATIRDNNIAIAVASLKDSSTPVQYSIEDFVNDIAANGERTISALRSLLHSRTDLFELEENRKLIAKAIDDSYYRKIICLKEELKL